MDLQEFKRSLADRTPPAAMTPELHALWMDASGDWDAAHRIAQSKDNRATAWVHAYLHRKEGDSSNAAYWYRRADRTVSRLSLDEEWDDIVSALLHDPPQTA